MQDKEIDTGTEYTGFEEALDQVRSNTWPENVDELSLTLCSGLVSAGEVKALVSSPTQNSSLKDGFAVISNDIKNSSSRHPVTLKLKGSVFAGGQFAGEIFPGETVKVLTGAPVPSGADAIVAEELCVEEGDSIMFGSSVAKGKNIMPAGEDVTEGAVIMKRGEVIHPASLAYAATAGISRLKVYRKPKIAIISIGDELVEPGKKLNPGQIYASNSIHTGAWLSMYNVPFENYTVPDDAYQIRNVLQEVSLESDVIITSGGVMHSERDLIVGILDDFGWEMKFRHVRMGPGKATAFGLWNQKPVFCFSGGPTSNGIAFLQFGLPGILNMMGYSGKPFIEIRAPLTREIKSRNRTWTEFKEGRIINQTDGLISVTPLTKGSRLKSMAEADCLIRKPEGVELLERDQVVTVQLLRRLPVGISGS
ncbi:MAG: molybdopterin molybdotransferase MoeA [Dehalococcoidales bacterium]|nr:molybdopterin molybdotransferase MoeA [Dehalococcoidales bacterium]